MKVDLSPPLRQVSVALVGAGFIGAVHARNLAAHPQIDLRYVVEPNESIGGAVAAQHGAEWLDRIGPAVADPDLDAIWIAAPAGTHVELIRQSGKADKAIFCEKPLGTELVDVDRLVAELKGYSQPIMIGFNRRFDPSHARLKQLIDDGAIGAVEMVGITSRDPNPPPVDYMRATPGGIFYDTMIHDLDMARWLLGEEPTEVYATGSCHLATDVNPDGELDAATATLKTASGAVCQISVSRRATYGYDQRIEVFGSRGMAQSENQPDANVRIYGKDGIKTPPLKNFFIDRYADAYVREIDAFVAAVIGGARDYPKAVDGREAFYLSLQALQSAKEARPIRLVRGSTQTEEIRS